MRAQQQLLEKRALLDCVVSELERREQHPSPDRSLTGQQLRQSARDAYEAQLTQREHDVERLQQELTRAGLNLKSREEEQTATRQELERLRGAELVLSDQRHVLESMRVQLTEREEEGLLLRQQLELTEVEKLSLTEQLEQLCSEGGPLAEQQAQIQELRELLQRGEAQQLEAQHESLASDARATELEAELRGLQSTLSGVEAEHGALSKEVLAKEARLREQQQQLTELHEQADELRLLRPQLLEHESRGHAAAEELERSLERLRTVEDELLAARSQLGQLEKGAAAAELQTTELSKQLAAKDAELLASQEKVQAAQAGLELVPTLESKLSEAGAQLEAQRSETQQLRDSLQEMSTQLQESTEHQSVLREELQAGRASAALEQAEVVAQLNTALADGSKGMEQLRSSEGRVVELQHQIAELEAQVSVGEAVREGLGQEVSTRGERVEQLEAELQYSEAERQLTKEELDELWKAYEENEAKHLTQGQALEESERERRECEAERSELRTELKLIKEELGVLGNQQQSEMDELSRRLLESEAEQVRLMQELQGSEVLKQGLEEQLGGLAGEGGVLGVQQLRIEELEEHLAACEEQKRALSEESAGLRAREAQWGDKLERQKSKLKDLKESLQHEEAEMYVKCLEEKEQALLALREQLAGTEQHQTELVQALEEARVGAALKQQELSALSKMLICSRLLAIWKLRKAAEKSGSEAMQLAMAALEAEQDALTALANTKAACQRLCVQQCFRSCGLGQVRAAVWAWSRKCCRAQLAAPLITIQESDASMHSRVKAARMMRVHAGVHRHWQACVVRHWNRNALRAASEGATASEHTNRQLAALESARRRAVALSGEAKAKKLELTRLKAAVSLKLLRHSILELQEHTVAAVAAWRSSTCRAELSMYSSLCVSPESVACEEPSPSEAGPCSKCCARAEKEAAMQVLHWRGTLELWGVRERLVRAVIWWKQQSEAAGLQLVCQEVASSLTQLEQVSAGREEELALLLSRAYWTHALYLVDAASLRIHQTRLRHHLRTWCTAALLHSARAQRDAAVSKVPILLRAAKSEMTRLRAAAVVMLHMHSMHLRSSALLHGFSVWQLWCGEAQLEFHSQLTSADVLLHIRAAACARVLISQKSCNAQLLAVFTRMVRSWACSQQHTLPQLSTTPQSSPRGLSLSGRISPLQASKIPVSPVASSIREEAERSKTVRRVLRSLRADKENPDSALSEHSREEIQRTIQTLLDPQRALSQSSLKGATHAQLLSELQSLEEHLVRREAPTPLRSCSQRSEGRSIASSGKSTPASTPTQSSRNNRQPLSCWSPHGNLQSPGSPAITPATKGELARCERLFQQLHGKHTTPNSSNKARPPKHSPCDELDLLLSAVSQLV